ncbi:hypothetical protein BS78_K093700 [Paspalum vaginatum]|uniref:Transposase Tnp1/En/Spm-like domain-containing protein n=1 Tax=Paspalum vaginatum TaxID=158149 RepID=A0A9W7X8C8_9POAL|nr:hypothetical protein BS78_K093700 [Paspalum vaginatum]
MERCGRRRGLGLLAGGVGSRRISEALVEVQEVRDENKKLWTVVQTLMSNQTKLEQQYDELKSQISTPQRCPSVESSLKVDPPMQPMNDDNQGGSISRSNKRHGTKLQESSNVVLPSMKKKKRKISQTFLQQNPKERTPPPTLPEQVKKSRKFQTPLDMDEKEGIKCGMEVGLASPNSKKMVALGTIQKTDGKAKACDGHPLADCVEVLVSIVFKQTAMLPRAHGKIQKLGSATAHCKPWPWQNIICSDGTPLQSKVCSGTMSQVSLNRRDIVRVKRSTSKDDAVSLSNAQGATQSVAEKKGTKM